MNISNDYSKLGMVVNSLLVPELEADDVNAFAQSAKSQETVGSQLITGPSLVVTVAEKELILDNLVQMGKNAKTSAQAEAFQSMIKGIFEAMKNTADNIAPSEEELKLKEQKAEEIKKKEEELELRKSQMEKLEQLIEDMGKENEDVDLDKAIDRFESIFVSKENRALLEQMTMENTYRA